MKKIKNNPEEIKVDLPEGYTQLNQDAKGIFT